MAVKFNRKKYKEFHQIEKTSKQEITVSKSIFCCIEKNVHEVDKFIEKWVNIVDSVEIRKKIQLIFMMIYFQKKIKTKNEC